MDRIAIVGKASSSHTFPSMRNNGSAVNAPSSTIYHAETNVCLLLAAALQARGRLLPPPLDVTVTQTLGQVGAPTTDSSLAARFPKLIGQSTLLNEIREEIVRVARSDAKVLVTGESGSGKELVAEALHQASTRSSGPFVAVNCAGIPETLLESELFGYVKGSFTGAFRDKPGKLEVANGGTVFLDEIGEMTLRMQGLLLRFLETGELQKVGAYGETRPVNVRVITATNRKLREMVTQGLFREDLFYRINVIQLTVPPLRERKNDIPLLIEHFVRQSANGRMPGRSSGLEFTSEAMGVLVDYAWPGNVRELRNVVERLVVNGRSSVVGVEALPSEIRSRHGIPARPIKERRRTVSDDLFKRLVTEGESFWSAVYPLYMQREITKTSVRDLVKKGLEEARGNYKIVLRLFNMPPEDYKKFLNFLRKHDCQPSFKEFR
jgi:transcriptional regulator with PAS, ATPase and Fis domain